jgi:hypothetical protein
VKAGRKIQITDGAALEEICYEWFAAVRRNIDKIDPQ